MQGHIDQIDSTVHFESGNVLQVCLCDIKRGYSQLLFWLPQFNLNTICIKNRILDQFGPLWSKPVRSLDSSSFSL